MAILSTPKVIDTLTADEQRIGHGVCISLPQEVISSPDYPNLSLEVAFASLGPVGPHFIFPKGVVPVSPAVWLCSSLQKEFHDRAILKLPHCFECKTLEDSKLLRFLKAEHEDIKRDENGWISIKFKEVDKAQSDFPPNSCYGILRDRHFCIYCLVAYPLEESILGKVNYCLTILKPKSYPRNENQKIYCILHFNLEDCKMVRWHNDTHNLYTSTYMTCMLFHLESCNMQLVQEQTPDGYDSVEKHLQFETGRYESALEIHVNTQLAIGYGWVITRESERMVAT